MFMLLCLAGWRTPVYAFGNHSQAESARDVIECTGCDVPQWQDIGMCDVLAVTGGSTLTPPTTVRVMHDSPSGTTPTTHATAARRYSVKRLSAHSHRSTVGGYIYMIRCLRL